MIIIIWSVICSINTQVFQTMFSYAFHTSFLHVHSRFLIRQWSEMKSYRARHFGLSIGTVGYWLVSLGIIKHMQPPKSWYNNSRTSMTTYAPSHWSWIIIDYNMHHLLCWAQHNNYTPLNLRAYVCVDVSRFSTLHRSYLCPMFPSTSTIFPHTSILFPHT